MSQYTKSTNFATKDNLSPGDPLKIVRGTEIDTEFNNISTAISTKTDNSAAAITGGSITGITDLAIADGGTGASTATAALNNLLPSQTGNGTKYLQTDGSNATWDAVSLSTSDITGTLPVANGGTGVTSSTGTGSVVLSNSPTLVTPTLGTPASGVATNLTGLPLTTGVTGTLPVANGGTGVTTSTGTGNVVLSTSPTLVTPALGTPSALVGTNITGTASGLTAGNVTTNANLTGAVTSVGNATSLGSFTSAQLLGALSDETGTGSAVFATSPTLVTPILGTPTSATLTNATGLPISTGVSGLGTGVATFLATPSSANLRSALTDETGTGSAVFATSPTLVTPVLGTPTSATLTNATGLPLTTGVTGTLPTANGGTNLTSFTSGGVVYASSSSALATGSALTFDGTTPTSSNATGSPNFIFNSNANTPYIRFDQSGASKFTIGASAIVAGGAGYDFYGTAGIGFTFFTNASRRLDITSAGDVGIGTSSPSAKLTVVSTYVSDTTVQTRFSDNTGGRLEFGGNASAGKWICANDSGTATAVPLIFQNGSNVERMRLDASGNLGIGTSSPAFKTEIVGGADTVETTLLQIRSNFGGIGTGSTIVFRNSTNSTGDSGGVQLAALRDTTSGGSLVIRTADSSGTIQNRVKITETGLVAIGTTTAVSGNTNARLVVKSSGGSDACEIQATTNGILAFDFRNSSGTQAGSITINSSSVAYNTSSDYRLKNTIAPMTGALAKVAQLKPVTYKWNADGSDGEGFIAHELAEVCPYAVTGAKDAVDANGNIKPQGIDVSFLVATLTAALQEQQAIIESLKARLDAANL